MTLFISLGELDKKLYFTCTNEVASVRLAKFFPELIHFCSINPLFFAKPNRGSSFYSFPNMYFRALSYGVFVNYNDTFH